MVWADEFDYKGLPDPQKWSYEDGRVRNQELQYFTRDRLDNARVEDGLLTIESRRELYKSADYTSASLITLNRAHWKYGRVVIRAKLPRARGTWPAFWMFGEDRASIGWPRCGEIDIMEHVGHEPGVIHGTVHQADANGQHIQDQGTTTIPDFADTFHVYAVEWFPDRIDFFVDGKKYHTFPNQGPGKWSFDKPFYLIINMAVGGSWGGQKGVDDTAFPQQCQIDYVRVYQKP